MRFLIVFVIVLLSSPVFARVKRGPHHSTNDPTYCAALHAADLFLHAWQTQDHEAGIMMLSDGARQHTSQEQLEDFFSPGANAAFEIEHGKRHKSGEYVFPVALFGTADASRRVRFGQIVIVRAGKDWAVERLP